jgi:AsmA protein
MSSLGLERDMFYRLKWAALLVAVFALTIAGAYRWPISSAYVASEFGRQLTHSVGLELRGPARAYLSILPLPSIQIVDLELRGKNGVPVISAPNAKAQLAIAPLFLGRLKFSTAKLRRPTVLIDLDHAPFAEDSALGQALDKGGSVGDAATLGVLRFEGGLLHIVSAKNEVDTLIEDVDGELNWPRVADPLRLELQATWRDAPVKVSARLANPAAYLSGGGSSAAVDLASPLASLKLDGALKPDDGGFFEGGVSAEVASVSALAKVLGKGPLRLPSDGRVALAGKIAAKLRMATLSDMQLDAFTQKFDGALALARTPAGWSLSGSLAADTLNLDDIVAATPVIFDGNGEWSAEPLSLGPIALALDLRTSVGKATWGGRTILQEAALSFMTHDGGATATLSEATAYKGMLKGEISVTPDAHGVKMHASASLANADVGAFIADLGSTAYSGQGGAELSLQSSGDSPAALAKSLSGDASIKLGAGVIEGLSFEEALRRSERRSINPITDMRTGRTVFNEAEARATIEKGEAHVRTAAMIGPGVLVTMKGGADLVARALATQFIATRADQHGAPDLVGPQINVTISGPWLRPIIKTDTGA